MNDGKRERERVEERANRRGRQEGESARERGKNGGGRERGRNVSSSSPPLEFNHTVFTAQYT